MPGETNEYRIARLESTLGSLIHWLCWGALRPDETKALLTKLNLPSVPPNIQDPDEDDD